MNKLKKLLNFYITSINLFYIYITIRIYIHIYIYIGENSQIPRFGKICGKLALFLKYLVIYHFFSTQVPQNRVLNNTQVQ